MLSLVPKGRAGIIILKINKQGTGEGMEFEESMECEERRKESDFLANF